jgi:hypothetical protein
VDARTKITAEQLSEEGGTVAFSDDDGQESKETYKQRAALIAGRCDRSFCGALVMTVNQEKEYLLFCDESDKRGRYYSNFYGGVRIAASQLTTVETALTARKQTLGLTSEIKWQKVGVDVVERYEQFMREFFDQIAAGRVCMRVMFTQNAQVPVGLTREQQEGSY